MKLQSKLLKIKPLLFVVPFAGIGTMFLIFSSADSASTISVTLPADSNTCSTQFASQNNYGHVTGLAPPGGGYPNVYQRLNDNGFGVYRIMGTTNYDTLSTTIPSPANIAAGNYAPHNLAAWSFAGLDKELSAAPANIPREFVPFAPPDALFTGNEYYDPAIYESAQQGDLADQSYSQLADYMADLVTYYRSPMLVSNSGSSVTYTSTSLTDTAKDFSSYGSGDYAVTATVMDNNGFPDWVTAQITSVTNGGHTLNFGAGWSSANSGGGTLSSTTPAAAAAYNLDTSSPPAAPDISTANNTSNLGRGWSAFPPYSTGTISQAGTTITGTGTTFTPAMTGSTIIYSDNSTATVTYVSATSLTSSVSKTVTAGSSYQVYGGSQWSGLVSFANATPWPRPPSVGNVEYWEMFNEPEYSSYNYPRTTPPVEAPTQVTLSGTNTSGGTLTPGSTYTYELTGIDEARHETVPSSAVSITLPVGDNAVQVNWNASPTYNNLGLEPDAYRIYGRTSGSDQAMVVVGRDTGSDPTVAWSWTDKGTVTPSGAAPSSGSASGGLQIWRSNQYVNMWNAVTPTMKAVDPTIKLTGPTQGGGDLFVGGDVNTSAVTTGPSDTSWESSLSYIQALVAGSNPKPDAVTFHNYGWYQGTSSTEAEYWADLSSVYTNYAADIADAKSAGIPVWVDETNIDAGFIGSQGQSNSDLRAETQMGSAWLADEFAKSCNLEPDVTQLFQFADYNGDISWGMVSGASYSGSSTCVPQPNCQNITTSQPNLEYWVMQQINKNFPPGSLVVPVSGVPSGFAAFAAEQPDSSKVSVLVVNTQIGASDGTGSPGSVNIQLSGATPTDVKETTVDGTTDILNGPTTTDLGAVSNVALNMNGYAATILSYDTNASPSASTDLNNDGTTNVFDLSIFLNHYGQAGSGLPGDFNGDGRVDATDLGILQEQYGG